MNRLRRAYCWVTMHDMPAWPEGGGWLELPDGSHWRRRYCQRCADEAVEINV